MQGLDIYEVYVLYKGGFLAQCYQEKVTYRKKGACPDFIYYSKLWVWALSPTFIRNVLMRRLDIDDH